MINLVVFTSPSHRVCITSYSQFFLSGCSEISSSRIWAMRASSIQGRSRAHVQCMYVHTMVGRKDGSFESDSHYGDSELPSNKIPRMDMDERKRFACRAKNPLCSAGKSITASFFSPELFRRSLRQIGIEFCRT